MKKTPTISSDPQILAVIHRAGRTWRGLIASTAGSQPSILAHREFAADQILRLDQWLDEYKAGSVLCVLPSSVVICRNTPLPDAPAEQLSQALYLQAEAHLLGIAPPHRMAMAVLPNAAGETTRNGLVLAWPEAANFTPPTTSRPITFVPDVAAIAAILGDQRPDEGVYWIDREDGSVALAITHSGGAMLRAIREEPHSTENWSRNIGRTAAETALSVGHTGEFVQTVMRDAQGKADTIRPGESRLFVPASLLPIACARVQGLKNDASWWAGYGVAAGALLARTGELSSLTAIKDKPQIEMPSPVRRVLDQLSNPRVSAAVIAACVLVLMFGPLAFSGLRLMVLNVRFHDVDSHLIATQASKRKLAVYQELEKQKTWPMTKLLADITVNTPLGIELETIRLESGKDFAVSGTALATKERTPAQLVALFQENLTRGGMFADVAVTAGKTDNLGRYKFDLSAKVTKPYYQPQLNDDLDFAKTPWSVRLYGEPTGDGTTSAAASAQAPFTPTNPTPEVELSQAGLEEDPMDSSSRAMTRRGEGFVGESPADRGDDFPRANPTAVPPPIDVEQLKVMSRAELRDTLAKVAGARQNRDLEKEVEDRLKEETKLIMEYLKKAPS